MKNPEKKEKESRKSYEPPKLLNLGGSVAYAQEACKVGGSPSIATCTTGAAATAAACKVGAVAGATCGSGGAAAGGSCKVGSTATYSCKTGNNPM